MKHYKLFVLFFILIITVSNAQSVFSCKIDGDDFVAKNFEAVQIKMLNTDYIQIKIENDGKLLFLYFKMEKLKGKLPVKLEYSEPNENQIPDVELVWAPNPDEPQWNSIEGEAEITSFDEETKTLSGTFEFVIEKMEYGTKKKKPRLDIEDGVFKNIIYRLEEGTN